jgi:hypothetical protein
MLFTTIDYTNKSFDKPIATSDHVIRIIATTFEVAIFLSYTTRVHLINDMAIVNATINAQAFSHWTP